MCSSSSSLSGAPLPFLEGCSHEIPSDATSRAESDAARDFLAPPPPASARAGNGARARVCYNASRRSRSQIVIQCWGSG